MVFSSIYINLILPSSSSYSRLHKAPVAHRLLPVHLGHELVHRPPRKHVQAVVNVFPSPTARNKTESTTASERAHHNQVHDDGIVSTIDTKNSDAGDSLDKQYPNSESIPAQKKASALDVVKFPSPPPSPPPQTNSSSSVKLSSALLSQSSQKPYLSSEIAFASDKYLCIDDASLGFNNQRGRLGNLIKLGIYLNRTIVLPSTVKLSKHALDSAIATDEKYRFDFYFDIEHLHRHGIPILQKEDFVAQYGESVLHDNNSLKIQLNKKKVILVDSLDMMDKSKKIYQNIMKDVSKLKVDIIEMGEPGEWHADQKIIYITGAQSMQGCCIIRFHSPELDAAKQAQSEGLVRLAPFLHDAATKVVAAVHKQLESKLGSRYQNDFDSIHMRAYEWAKVYVVIFLLYVS